MDDRDPLTERIIKCAIEVHRVLGPGLLEGPYRAALQIELAANGIHAEREPTYPVLYRGHRIADFRPDLIVDSSVVVEVKSVARYDPVFAAQLLTYLRVTGLHTGLLLNFNRPTLVQGVRRFVL